MSDISPLIAAPIESHADAMTALFELAHTVIDKLNWFTEDDRAAAHATVDAADPNAPAVPTVSVVPVTPTGPVPPMMTTVGQIGAPLAGVLVPSTDTPAPFVAGLSPGAPLAESTGGVPISTPAATGTADAAPVDSVIPGVASTTLEALRSALAAVPVGSPAALAITDAIDAELADTDDVTSGLGIVGPSVPPVIPVTPAGKAGPVIPVATTELGTQVTP